MYLPGGEQQFLKTRGIRPRPIALFLARRVAHSQTADHSRGSAWECIGGCRAFSFSVRSTCSTGHTLRLVLRTGLRDFEEFLMQDFFRAAVFHWVLGSATAALLGRAVGKRFLARRLNRGCFD